MNDKKYLLICNTSDGLIAQLNGIVAQLQFARDIGFEPIVYLHGRSYMFGGPNPYFDPSHGDNVWNYYCKPIGTTEGLAGLIAEGRVFTLATASELARLYRWEPKSWFMNPYGYYRSVENRADGDYPEAWWLEQREKARALIRDGVFAVREDIQNDVDRFVRNNFSAHMLGVHMRGSDKFDFGVGQNLSKKIVPEDYFPYIDDYFAKNPGCEKIFVATDQRQWLRTMEAHYPGKVVSFSEKSLSDSNENQFHKADGKASRGLEVLMDVLLLSRCDFLLKCHAAVGEMALTLNPDLKFIDLNYADQPFEARPTPARAVCAPAIRLIAAIWKGLSERGMALEKVVAVEEDRILVGQGRSLHTKVEAGVKAPRAALFSRRFVSDGFDWALRRLGDACFTYEEKAARR